MIASALPCGAKGAAAFAVFGFGAAEYAAAPARQTAAIDARSGRRERMILGMLMSIVLRRPLARVQAWYVMIVPDGSARALGQARAIVQR